MDGFLLVNKDLGYTSRDVVNAVNDILNTKKVGHTGTLDPMASGVLVLCVGKALKMSELLMNHTKDYIAGITLGIETDTLDMDGKILRDETVDISVDKIKDVVNSFVGTYSQIVPKYSAVKVNGRKLYEYARSGVDVNLPTKNVNIESISIIDDIVSKNGKIHFKIKCSVSKGTYIRALVRDIGIKLGVPAVMDSLVRTRVGSFKISDCFSLDDVKNGNYELISILDAFPDIPKIVVDEKMAFKIRNGVIINNLFNDEMAFILDNNNTLMALYKKDNEKCRVYKMFI